MTLPWIYLVPLNAILVDGHLYVPNISFCFFILILIALDLQMTFSHRYNSKTCWKGNIIKNHEDFMISWKSYYIFINYHEKLFHNLYTPSIIFVFWLEGDSPKKREEKKNEKYLLALSNENIIVKIYNVFCPCSHYCHWSKYSCFGISGFHNAERCCNIAITIYWIRFALLIVTQCLVSLLQSGQFVQYYIQIQYYYSIPIKLS